MILPIKDSSQGLARQRRWTFLLAATVAAMDLLSKAFVQRAFALGESHPVTDFLNLVYVMNPGAAFSFLAGAGGWQRPALIGIGVLISFVLGFVLTRNRQRRLAAAGLASILGGAVGNVVDRARHGAVVDWLDFHLAGWHWPAFNFADIGIVLGVAALLIDGLVKKPLSRGDI